VVNENDTVVTEEIRYGDNDRLAARVAQMVGADLLVLLSDIDGLYTADPRRDPSATHIERVRDHGRDRRHGRGGQRLGRASAPAAWPPRSPPPASPGPPAAPP
jgi:glutamate 5-kinase